MKREKEKSDFVVQLGLRKACCCVRRGCIAGINTEPYDGTMWLAVLHTLQQCSHEGKFWVEDDLVPSLGSS